MAIPNGKPWRRKPSHGSSAATTCPSRSPIVRQAVAAMDCTPIAPTRIAAVSQSCPIFSVSRRFVSLRAPIPSWQDPRRFAPSAPEFYLPLQRTEGIVSKATFLNRQALYLRPDPARVIVRPFKPATEPRDLNPTDKTRANHIVDRVLALDSKAVVGQLADVLENFQGRHRNLLETFEARADEMEEAFATHGAFSKIQRQLIGAYFLNEYSFEASALFNPSIVPHPDQSDAPKGGLRFILSLRAIGEGHVSSLTFRGGTFAADGSLTVDPTARLASSPRIRNRVSGPDDDHVELIFKPEEELSERVIFPVTESQSNGIEDLLFVDFSGGGRKPSHATYTAYSGRSIRSELIETHDFMSFRLAPLRGPAA